MSRYSGLMAAAWRAPDPRSAGQSHQGRGRTGRSDGQGRPLWAMRNARRNVERNEHAATAPRSPRQQGGWP